MLLAKRSVASAIQTALFAVVVVAVTTALVPRGASLRHLASTGIRTRVTRSHADRPDNIPVAARSGEAHFQPTLFWAAPPDLRGLAAEHLEYLAALGLRAPPAPF